LKNNKFVNKDGLTLGEAADEPATEQSIKQMFTQLNKSDIKVFNGVSANSMNYEQIMGCLGKKTIKQRKLLRHKQVESDDDSAADM
jgi:hypothetical protein